LTYTQRYVYARCMQESAKRHAVFFVAIILVGIFAVIYFAKTHTEQNLSMAITAIPTSPTPIPTLAPIQENNSVNSPDGTKKLTLISETLNNTTHYSLLVVDIQSGSQQVVWTSTENVDTKITVPLNAWSPDNKYFFLLNTQQNIPHPMIFNATGAAFSGGEIYLDAFSLFASKQSTYSITNATGWASNTLIYIQTSNTSTNAKGPTFWFEVPSKNFIQLAG